MRIQNQQRQSVNFVRSRNLEKLSPHLVVLGSIVTKGTS